jgi:hypothetical protein
MCSSVIIVVERVSAVLRGGMGNRSLFVRSVIGLFLESSSFIYGRSACMIYDLRSMIPGCMIGFGVFVSASWILDTYWRVCWLLFVLCCYDVDMFCLTCTFC